MGRFYRHVLIGKRYRIIALWHLNMQEKYYCSYEDVGNKDVAFNQPANMLYKDENPFK